MHRTPSHRKPRVAALIPVGRGGALVVLDLWEVRAAVVSLSSVRLCRILLQERPTVVVTPRAPKWLRRLRLAIEQQEAPSRPRSLAAHPELRRFIGTAAEHVIRQAITLAFSIITQKLL